MIRPLLRRHRRGPAPEPGIPLGRTVAGEVLSVPRPSGDPQHGLISGTTGAGKTVLLRTWVGGLAGLDDVALLGLDPKRTGLSPWSPRFTTVAKSVAECSALLVRIWIEVDRRLDVLDARGVSEWRPEFGGPFLVVPIDELVEVASVDGSRVADVLSDDALSVGPIGGADRGGRTKALRAELAGAKTSQQAQGVFLASLARICRSAGVQLIAATQYPMSEVVDPQLRSNMGLRVMLRVPSDEMVPVCLGHGNHEGITAASISTDERGGMWVTGLPGAARPIRARGFLVTDADVAARAAETAHLRWAPEDVFPGQLDRSEAPDTTAQPRLRAAAVSGGWSAGGWSAAP